MYAMPQSVILPYHGVEPKFGKGSFLAAGACVIGDVIAGEDTSFWFNTVVRGDCQIIRIGDRTNVQDGTVIHVTNGKGPTHIGSDVTIGHGAVIHACTIADRCLIGMGSIILDNVKVGTNCFVGAGALLPPGKEYPPGSLIVGSPAKVVRPLTEKELAFLGESVENYLAYKKGYMPKES